MEEAIHPGNGGGHEVPLLAEELHISPFLPLLPQMGDAGEEHASRSAGGVVDGLARLDIQHLGHEVDNGTVRIELSSRMAGVIGKLLDKVLVALAELILGEICHRQLQGGEVLDEVAQHRIGESLPIRPLGVPEDAEELLGIRSLDGAYTGLDRHPNIAGGLTEPTPMPLLGDLEAVILWIGGELGFTARFLQGDPGLLVKDITEALVEKQRKDELLVVSGINRPAQKRGCPPKVGLKLLLGDAATHRR